MNLAIDFINLSIAALLIFAALRDIAARTVPNWVSIAIAAAGIILQGATGHFLAAITLSALIFSVAIIMWHRGWLGGADIKLLAAGGLAVAPNSVGQLLIAVALAGGVLAIIYLGLFRLVRRPAAGRRTAFLARILKAESWRIHHRGPLPYAVAIAIGFLSTLYPS